MKATAFSGSTDFDNPGSGRFFSCHEAPAGGIL